MAQALDSGVRADSGKTSSPMGVAVQRLSHDVPTGRAAPVGFCSGVPSHSGPALAYVHGMTGHMVRTFGLKTRRPGKSAMLEISARPAKPVPSRLAHRIPQDGLVRLAMPPAPFEERYDRRGDSPPSAPLSPPPRIPLGEAARPTMPSFHPARWWVPASRDGHFSGNGSNAATYTAIHRPISGERGGAG